MTARADLASFGPNLTVRFAETLSTGKPTGFYNPMPVTRPVREREARELLEVIRTANPHHAIVVRLENAQATATVIGLDDPQRVQAILYAILSRALEIIVGQHLTGELPNARAWTVAVTDGRAILDTGPNDAQAGVWVLEQAVKRLDDGI